MIVNLSATPPQAFFRIVIFGLSVGQMRAQDLEIVLEPAEVAPQPGQGLKNGQRGFFDLEPLEPQDDDLKISIKGIRGDRDNPLLERVGKEAFFLPKAFVLEDGLVIDVFGRDVHQGKIIGSFVRKDVFCGDSVDVFLDVAHEFLLKTVFFLQVVFLDVFFEILQREFGVDRDQAVADLDGGVHFSPLLNLYWSS